MAGTIESQEGTPIRHDPNDAPWYSDLKEGTGAAEGMDPALQEALIEGTRGVAIEQAGQAIAAEDIPDTDPSNA